MDHDGAEGAQSQGGAERLTDQGGDMGLNDRGEAGESITPCQTGDHEARGGAIELHRASGMARAEELDDTRGEGVSKRMDGTSRMDETR